MMARRPAEGTHRHRQFPRHLFRPHRRPGRYLHRRATAISSTEAEAVRFALQAQFSVSDADITALTSAGWLAWLNARYDEPLGQTGVDWLNSHGHNAITAERRYRAHEFGDYMIWNQLLAGPDQMRKRMALALSEMFVVSLNSFDDASIPRI